MKCPICSADCPTRAKVCQSCGSNLNTRGGADIKIDDSGNAHHAGNSRWKSSAGLAGGGLLVGLGKFGLLSSLLKFYLIFRLFHYMTLSTTGLIIGLIGLAVMVGFGLKRYVRGGSIF